MTDRTWDTEMQRWVYPNDAAPMVGRLSEVMRELLDDHEADPRVFARAALHAILKPTEAMLEKASGFPITRDLAADIWEEMVKEALQEPAP